MRKLAAFAILSVFCSAAFAQEITGQWNGVLKVQGMQLRIVFHISKSGEDYASTMDSPDQGATGIPVSSTSFENSTLKLAVVSAGLNYEGKLGKDGVIVGNLNQAGQTFPVNLSREEVEKEEILRPQEPKKPYPYVEEDVKFENKDADITLAGTLTLPGNSGNYPAVVLISGSGPQNRDEELLGHKPFLVLSDFLTRNGIAVLRFDDRGTASSTGDFSTAISQDFATDVEAAIGFLKKRMEINSEKIGLIGHSEGGIIAPMVASRSKDVDFIVLLAGTGIPGDQILLLQQELIGRASGMSEEALAENKSVNKDIFAMVRNSSNIDNLREELRKYISELIEKSDGEEVPDGMSDEDFINLQLMQVVSPWMINFIKYDPAPILEKVSCPVLAINGEKDLQVPPKENLDAIETALKKAGNKNVTLREIPNLNHLFQESTTGSPSEYATIQQTFSPIALKIVLDWIERQVD